MHIPRLTQLAEWLEAGAPHKNGVDHFDMGHGVAVTSCGTACCIAGAATQFFGGEVGQSLLQEAKQVYEEELGDDLPTPRGEAPWQGDGLIDGVFGHAMELLELDQNQARELFTPKPIDQNFWSLITPAEAAQTIRQLIATGEVDWSHSKALDNDDE